MSDFAPSAVERGDTVPGWVRWVVRLLAVAVFAGATLTVALVRSREDAGGPAAPPSAGATRASSGARTAAENPLRHAARQVRLLDAEDARLRRASLGDARGSTRIAGTLVLGARPAPYHLADLVRAHAATRVSASVVLVTAPVTVRRDAALVIDAPGTTLRLASGARGFASLVSWGGDITVAGARGKPVVVEAWDSAADQPDRDPTDGRAYLRVKDGALTVEHARLSHLGFWSGRTGGLALTGSDETVAVATLTDVRIAGGEIGLYLSGVHRVRADHLTVRATRRHGVEVTNRSSDVQLSDLVVREPGEDGLSVSNGSSHVRMDAVTVTGAGGYGIDIDGSPLADGPNSAGYGIGNYAWVRIDHARVHGNHSGGVRVLSVDHLAVADSRIAADRSALVVRGGSADVAVGDSRLRSVDGTGLVLAGGVREARISGSTVAGSAVGVEVDDSTATIDDSEITVGTGHGVLATGRSAEVSLSGNTIHGRGSAAVHGADGAIVTGGDSAGRWTYRPELVLWAERHSAAMPLLLVLVVPLVGLVFVVRRRRQQRELRRIFEATLIAQGRSAIAAYRSEDAGVESARVEAARMPSAEQPPDARQPAAPLAEREFASAREFALAAVREAGYAPHVVARVLHVPTSRVRDWVATPETPETPVGAVVEDDRPERQAAPAEPGDEVHQAPDEGA